MQVSDTSDISSNLNNLFLLDNRIILAGDSNSQNLGLYSNYDMKRLWEILKKIFYINNVYKIAASTHYSVQVNGTTIDFVLLNNTAFSYSVILISALLKLFKPGIKKLIFLIYFTSEHTLLAICADDSAVMAHAKNSLIMHEHLE